MSATLPNISTQPNAHLDPLPLAWFEFITPPRPAREYHPDAPGTAPATWTVQLDGRDVPFKFIRKPTENPPPADNISASNFQHSKFIIHNSSPSRPVLILLHGMGITVAAFHGIAPYLFQTHDLVLIDYTSFSVERGWPSGGVPMRMLAASIWKVADALHLGRVSLAGASLGGGLAIMATQQRPQSVERIVLFNPAIYPQRLPRMYNMMRTPILGELLMAITPPERFVDGVAWVGYSVPEKIPAELRRIYTQTLRPYANRIRLMDLMRHLPGSEREMRQHIQQIKTIKQHILVLWGCQERLLGCNAARRLAHDLPHVRYHEFPALAHTPHEEEPDLIGPIVAAFLADDIESDRKFPSTNSQ